MSQNVLNNHACTLVETNSGNEFGHGTFQLRVVENYGASLVAEQSAIKVVLRAHGCQKVRRDVVGFQFDTEDIGDDLVNLVPCKVFVTSNLECLADGVLVAHQADECLGEIRVVS